MSELRIGLGVDAHAFEEGVPLVLGGVAIEHPRGLAGHSDGDVIAHALTDALLGAAGLADIGALFPSDDERLRGADSLELLAEAYRQVTAAGYALVNADCVLIGQEPRIAPFRDGDGRAPRVGARRRLRPGGRARDDHRLPRVHGEGRRARRAGGSAARGEAPLSLRFFTNDERRARDEPGVGADARLGTPGVLIDRTRHAGGLSAMSSAGCAGSRRDPSRFRPTSVTAPDISVPELWLAFREGPPKPPWGRFGGTEVEWTFRIGSAASAAFTADCAPARLVHLSRLGCRWRVRPS